MSLGLPERVRTALTLTRFQALVGLVAGVLSIGATVWGIVFATREPVTFGTHGPVREHYGTAPGQYPDHPTTLDYVVAAAAG